MTYRDIILEGVPSQDNEHAPPTLPAEYMREHLSCIPRIPVPNGRFVFYMRGPTAVIDRLEADPRVKPQIIATSWTDLFFGKYSHWDWVFDLDVTEQRGTDTYRIRRKLAHVTEQEIHGIYVPGVFAGDAVPDLQLPTFVIERYQRLRSDTQLVVPTLSSIHDALVERIRKRAIVNAMRVMPIKRFTKPSPIHCGTSRNCRRKRPVIASPGSSWRKIVRTVFVPPVNGCTATVPIAPSAVMPR